MIESALHWLIEIIKAMGYPGVFIMSALESTFVPIPSEVTLIPAGYLIHQGVWNGPLVFVLATLGTLAGSLANYALAYFLGRSALLKFGHYIHMNEKKLEWIEGYFARHGKASIFLGRLVLGVRHFISFPAGLAKMDVKLFSLYTVLGGGLWTLILLTLGYVIGDQQERIYALLPAIKIGFVALVAAAIAFYVWCKKR